MFNSQKIKENKLFYKNYKSSSSSESDTILDCLFFLVSMSELSSSDEYILLLSTVKKQKCINNI